MTCHVIVAFTYHKNSRFKKVPIGLTRSVVSLTQIDVASAIKSGVPLPDPTHRKYKATTQQP